MIGGYTVHTAGHGLCYLYLTLTLEINMSDISIERPKLTTIQHDDGTYGYFLNASGWKSRLFRVGKEGKHWSQGFKDRDTALAKGRELKSIFNREATLIEKGKVDPYPIVECWTLDGTLTWVRKPKVHSATI